MYGVSRASASWIAAPASARAAALCVWWSAAAVGRGTRMLGFPQAHSSATVIAPARATTRSAARYAVVIGSKKPRTTTRPGTAGPAGVPGAPAPAPAPAPGGRRVGAGPQVLALGNPIRPPEPGDRRAV